MMMMIIDDSISSSSPTFWSSLTNWFTPTIFFILLQLVIATIYITSNLTHHKHHNQQQEHPLEPNNNNFFQHQNPIPRSPSLLHRLKSINFYYHHHEHHEQHQQQQQYQHEHHHQQEQPHEPNNLFQQQNPLPRSPSLLHRLKSINFYYHHEHHQQQNQQQQQPQILRSPSSMLQKLKSINLYSYLPTDPMSYFTTDTNRTHHEKTHVREIETAPPGKNQHYQSEEEDEEENDVVGEINWTNNNNHIESELGNSTMDEIFSRLQEGQNGNFSRTNSDTKPSSGEVPVKLARKMKKSASTKSAFSHFEEVDIVERRRPATVKEGSAAAAVTEEGDGGVDAKADDFINRFKQQLKLQRLDSIMRYKEMIGRGTGK